jgi:hypothetical protein
MSTGVQAREEGSVDDFRSRGAPLEYWFVKVSSGDLAFLADWIVRRDSTRAEVRISMWVRRIGQVLRGQSGVWREDGTGKPGGNPATHCYVPVTAPRPVGSAVALGCPRAGPRTLRQRRSARYFDE